MIITIELSYSPLCTEYERAITELLNDLSASDSVQIETGTMSSLLTGEYSTVMSLLTKTLEPYLETYPSVFRISLSNCCQSCKTSE
jgi:uncharacterized protein YqgV (UPF0045/DUF77 family)